MDVVKVKGKNGPHEAQRKEFGAVISLLLSNKFT